MQEVTKEVPQRFVACGNVVIDLDEIVHNQSWKIARRWPRCSMLEIRTCPSAKSESDHKRLPMVDISDCLCSNSQTGFLTGRDGSKEARSGQRQTQEVITCRLP